MYDLLENALESNDAPMEQKIKQTNSIENF